MQRREAHIVHCEERMLLDKGPYADWRAVQDAYADYKTSLGPWSEEEIVGFLQVIGERMNRGGHSHANRSRPSFARTIVCSPNALRNQTLHWAGATVVFVIRA